MISGNKIEKESEREVKVTDAETWCKNNGDIPYIEVSAVKDIKIEDTFQQVAKFFSEKL